MSTIYTYNIYIFAVNLRVMKSFVLKNIDNGCALKNRKPNQPNFTAKTEYRER